MSTFLSPVPGKTFQTRGSVYTADPNTGIIYNVPTGGYDQADLENAGCVILPFVPGGMFRNMLDGGDMTTNPFQRNVAGLQTTNSTGISTITNTPTYFADRWFAVGGSSSSVQLNVTADTSIPGFGQSLTFGRTISATNTAAMTLGSVLETNMSVKAQAQPVVFSFFGRTGSNYSGGAVTVSVIGGTATNQVGSVMVAGSWSGQTTIATGALTLTSNMLRYSVTGSVGTSITQLGVQLAYTPSGTASAGDYLFLNGFQLELGNAPSPFEHRDPAVELARCERFAWVLAEPTQSVQIMGGLSATAVSAVVGNLQFPVQMRAAPALTAALGSFAVGISGTPVSNLSTAPVLTGPAASVYSAPLKFTSAASAVAAIGNGAQIYGNGGSGYIVLSADL